MKDIIRTRAFYNKKVRVKGKYLESCYFESLTIKNDKYTIFIDCYFSNCHFEGGKNISYGGNVLNDCT